MRHIKDAVSQFLKRTGISERRDEDRIFEEWKKMAGAETAAMAEPFKVEGKKLFLQVANSVVMNEVTYKKKQIKNRINAFFGQEKIKDIVVRIRQN